MIEIPAITEQMTAWSSEDSGIRHNTEFARHDRRSLPLRTLHTAALIFHELHYILEAGYKRTISWCLGAKAILFDDAEPIGLPGSKGLVVLFHGLNGDVSVWDRHIQYLLKQAPELDIVALKVPCSGHCNVNGVESQALCKRIVEWAKQHPNQTVALFGQSNGTRFAMRMETWLRLQAPTTPIYVSLSGGVWYGSLRVNHITRWISTDKIHLFTLGFLREISCEELYYGSKVAKELLWEARQTLQVGVASRSYTMYACSYDSHVPDTGSSLPIINVGNCQEGKTEKHYLVAGAGHNSIVKIVMKYQVDDYLKWIEKIAADL